MKMYENDFVEPQLQQCANKISINCDELSRNDRRFFDLTDQKAVKVDGHYKLLLPLKDEDIRQRLESLRRKFEKDDQFFKEYKNFTEELMEKGYARKCDSKGPDSKARYVPHQGVLNHSKGKIRVVFDCSSQYRGTSINQNLLSEPDLTNQLVGILIKLKSRDQRTEKQRSFLRFLWCYEGNLDSEITDREMCVHLFGAVSSLWSSFLS